MSQADVLQIGQDAIFTIIEVAAPILLTGLVIGLLVSIFQAMTQINEQTLVFIPKIVGILLAILVCGSWMLTRLSEFTGRMFESIAAIVR